MYNDWKAAAVHHAAFNRRMNKDLYGILSGLTPRALARDRGSWFGSIIGMLNHLIVTDIHWLDRFRPLDSSATVFKDGRLSAFSLEWKPLSDDFGILSEGREVIDGLICEWFAAYPAEGYGVALNYEDSGGGTHGTTAWKAFDFLFMHQNYHRGQISQVLDEIGLPNSFADNGIFEEPN